MGRKRDTFPARPTSLTLADALMETAGGSERALQP